jgi:hypothetical protein
MKRNKLYVIAASLFIIGSIACSSNEEHHEGDMDEHHEEAMMEHHEGDMDEHHEDGEHMDGEDHAEMHAQYQCPMKCEGDKMYDEPGNCPACGMEMKEVETK